MLRKIRNDGEYKGRHFAGMTVKVLEATTGTDGKPALTVLTMGLPRSKAGEVVTLRETDLQS